jgi:hypothetical protein
LFLNEKEHSKQIHYITLNNIKVIEEFKEISHQPPEQNDLAAVEQILDQFKSSKVDLQNKRKSLNYE